MLGTYFSGMGEMVERREILTDIRASPQGDKRPHFVASRQLCERMTIMGLFKQATEKKKAETTTGPKRKSTTWLVGDPSGDAIGQAVHELTVLNAQSKAIDAKMEIHKNVVKRYAETSFLRDYADSGLPPDTPMIVQNHDGEKVTFVVQDRSGQYGVKDEQKDALIQLLGADAASELLYEETSFGFNRDILAIPGVQETIEKALEGALKKLTDTLTDEQKEALLDVKVKTAFKPGTMDKLALICGKDATRMKQFIDIAGSSCVRYVKV